jgi:two-component system osmolarity sensor histidine kinase EnvZ
MIGAFPKNSIARRALLNTIALIFLAQILAALILGFFVLRPQAQRVGSIVAHSILAVSRTAASASQHERDAMIAALDASEYLDVKRSESPPLPGGPPPGWLERIFMQSLVDTMGPETEMIWRTDRYRQLWLQVRIGPDLVWMSSNVPRQVQPLRALVMSLLVAFLMSILIAIIQQRRIARPLERLTQAVSAPHAAREGVATDALAASEITQLTNAFNTMSARLRETERLRALMLAGVSHDIRTPLAKLRLSVEMLAARDDDLAAAARRHVGEIDRLLDQFLIFARGPGDEPAHLISLDTLISEVAALRDVDGHNFIIRGDAIGDVRVRPGTLRRALLNLTENAIRYGRAPFAIEARSNSTTITIIVSDAGEGIEQALLDSVQSPFVRGANAPSGGAGLGLAIVAQAAHAHEGALVLSNTPTGFEATLTIARAL